MKVARASVFVGFVLVSFMEVASVHAQVASDTGVRKGMALRDVLAAWGEPQERIVRSVKHELVWNYKQGARVVFKDGKVISFNEPRAVQALQEKKIAKAAAAEKYAAAAAASVESKDVLRDIVRELPSGPDAPGGDAPPASSDPALAGLIPNAVPGRAVPPGVMVPAEEQD
jgi:hypothetical protein